MTTHAQMAADLLRSAAQFFRETAVSNEQFKDQMLENAQIFDVVAALVEADPTGSVSEDVAQDTAKRVN